MGEELSKGTGRQILKAGGLYFAFVFGAGFVLGTIRVLWIVPVVGTRTAELLEMPIMLGVVMLAAWWVVRHSEMPSTMSSRLWMGGIALVLTLILECTVVLWVQGLSFRQYVETFDPVAGTAYFTMLGVFAVMPFLMMCMNREQQSLQSGQ